MNVNTEMACLSWLVEFSVPSTARSFSLRTYILTYYYVNVFKSRIMNDRDSSAASCQQHKHGNNYITSIMTC